MIKELIFSSKKYFEGQTPNYLGKTISPLPTEHNKLKSYFSTGEDFELVPAGSYYYTVDRTLTISGQGFDHEGKTFLKVNRGIWISFDELLQNGGVLGSHLNHLYQALHRLFARKVVQA